MKQWRTLAGQGKRATVEYMELNKTIRRNFKKDIRRRNEALVEKATERNQGLKCLKPILGVPKIIKIKYHKGMKRETNIK